MTTRAERIALIRSAPGFLYISRPGDGRTRYVFERQTCVSLIAAYAYALELHLEATLGHSDPFAGLPGDGRDIDPFSGLLSERKATRDE